MYKKSNLREFIFGLPCLNETYPKLYRLPPRIFKKLSKAIQNLCRNLSGTRIRFLSKTSKLHFSAKVPRLSSLDNFSRNGQFGIDLYLNRKYYETYYQKKKIDHWFEFDSSQLYEFEIYLPIYGALEEIWIESEGEFLPPSPYLYKEPLIFYGSSITQGGCADRPGMSYTAILERKLNLDFVNLGFSGNGLGDFPIAEYIAETPAKAIILDWGANWIRRLGYNEFCQRYEKFIRIIRERQPTTPILLLNLPKVGDEVKFQRVRDYVKKFRDHVIEVFEKLKKEGDENLFLGNDLNFIPLDDEVSTVDGTHPNDFGFIKYAEGIEKLLKQMKIV